MTGTRDATTSAFGCLGQVKSPRNAQAKHGAQAKHRLAVQVRHPMDRTRNKRSGADACVLREANASLEPARTATGVPDVAGMCAPLIVAFAMKAFDCRGLDRAVPR